MAGSNGLWITNPDTKPILDPPGGRFKPSYEEQGVEVYRQLGGQHKLEIEQSVTGWEDHAR